MTVLQTLRNPYVRSRAAAHRVQPIELTQAFNSLGRRGALVRKLVHPQRGDRSGGCGSHGAMNGDQLACLEDSAGCFREVTLCRALCRIDRACGNRGLVPASVIE